MSKSNATGRSARNFYRIAGISNEQSLWFDMDGKETRSIHATFPTLKASQYPMPFDQDHVGWLSAAPSIDDLLDYFGIKSIDEMPGYAIYEYTTTAYRMSRTFGHTLIKKEAYISKRIVKQAS
jgi:hypothetical protein